MSMRLGPYELLLPVATGGMSEVFVAIRDEAIEPCIVKCVHPEIGADPSMRKRFWREAEVAALLDHPGIANVLDAGEHEGRLFLAMELVWGIDLAVLIHAAVDDEEPLPIDIVLAIIRPLLEALDHAHDLTDPQGEPLALVHRDLSARNVLIGLDGNVKLIDFGMARARLGSFRTSARKFIGGTPRYMSPEQALGREVERRSDLYSVGVLLHELLTARRLVADGDLEAVLRNVARSRPSDVCEVRPAIPEALGAAVAKSLRRYPEERWPTAAAFLAAIDLAPITPASRGSLAGQLAKHASSVQARRREVDALIDARRRRGVPAASTATASPPSLGTESMSPLPQVIPAVRTETAPVRDAASSAVTWPGTRDDSAATVVRESDQRTAIDSPVSLIPSESVVTEATAPKFVWSRRWGWVSAFVLAAVAVAFVTVVATSRSGESPGASTAPTPEASAPTLPPPQPVVVTRRADDEEAAQPPTDSATLNSPAATPTDSRRRVRRRPRRAPRSTGVTSVAPPSGASPSSEREPPKPEPPKPKPPNLAQMIGRARALRDRLDPNGARHQRANDLYSTLIFLGNANDNEAALRTAAAQLAELERAVENDPR